MFKRFAIVFMCLLYTIAVSGITVNTHYCGKMVEAVNIGSPFQNGGMGKMNCGSMKCCKDVHLDVKVKDAHVFTDSKQLTKLNIGYCPMVFVTGFRLTNTSRLSRTRFATGSNSPPGFRNPIYLTNRSLRI